MKLKHWYELPDIWVQVQNSQSQANKVLFKCHRFLIFFFLIKKASVTKGEKKAID